MSARITRPTVLAWDGATVQVAVPEDTRDARKLARTLAARACGTAILRGLVSAEPGAHGTTVLTWHPDLSRVSAPVAVTRDAVPAPAPDAGDAVARRIAELEAELARLRKGASAPREPREAPEFLRKAPAACEACGDHGVTRASGKRFRTAARAQEALASGTGTPCTARGCKAGATVRKARKAA